MGKTSEACELMAGISTFVFVSIVDPLLGLLFAVLVGWIVRLRRNTRMEE